MEENQKEQENKEKNVKNGTNFKTVVTSNPYNAKKLKQNLDLEKVYFYHFVVVL